MDQALPKRYAIAVLGANGVGKSALINYFMVRRHAAQNTNQPLNAIDRRDIKARADDEGMSRLRGSVVAKHHL